VVLAQRLFSQAPLAGSTPQPPTVEKR